MLLKIYGCCEAAEGEEFSVLPSELWLSNEDGVYSVFVWEGK